MYSIITSQLFLRQARKFFKKIPALNPRFVKIVDDLCHDPFQPHLELHPLAGKLKGCHSVSLAGTYRITLTLLITDKEIVLLDIGSHDEVYR